jgi:DHA1 family bicyclomycin/chloramphenicol resistance-like MFS transporter
LRIATVIAALAMIAMGVAVKADIGGMPAIAILVFIFFSMNGVVAASSTAAALDEVPEIAGSASALIGALQYGSGIVSSLLLASFGNGTPWTMTWIMLIFTCASAFIVAIKTKPQFRSLNV